LATVGALCLVIIMSAAVCGSVNPVLMRHVSRLSGEPIADNEKDATSENVCAG
jgi:hypothetical protein